MKTALFSPTDGLERLEAFLRERYYEYSAPVCWLPQRLHDLLFRVAAAERDEGRPVSADHIRLWEENGRIEACILPDGENVYFAIKKGREELFPVMLAFSEKNCLPLFTPSADGSVKLWTAVDKSLDYARKTLEESGWSSYPDEEYACCIRPAEAAASIVLPDGLRLCYGEEYPDEENKWKALRMGFHPEFEDGSAEISMRPYIERQRSPMYRDSFECLVKGEASGERNDVCGYCFVYVDRKTDTALIEPLSVREKYRRMGVGSALLRGAAARCRELGVEKCFVDCFGSRRDFYASAGFVTESSIVFYHKVLRNGR